jgi:hypothetical protein
MVLEYLPKIAFFHDGFQLRDLEYDYDYEDGRPRPKSAGKATLRPQSLLSPVARILRGSADAVSNAVLQARDGLTEEQRVAKRKLEERKQILYLRLKNVRESPPSTVTARIDGSYGRHGV